jgi:hypothetical protein
VTGDRAIDARTTPTSAVSLRAYKFTTPMSRKLVQLPAVSEGSIAYGAQPLRLGAPCGAMLLIVWAGSCCLVAGSVGAPADR